MSILARDNAARWALRQAHTRGEAFDESVEERPRSQAALDTLWRDGKGFLTRPQYEAGDWLRRLCNGGERPSNYIRPIVDNGRAGARVDNALNRDMQANGAMHAASLKVSFKQAYQCLEWTCRFEFALADIARRLKTDVVGRDHVHHEVAKRRIADCLEALADYKFGVDADRLAWRAKVGA